MDAENRGRELAAIVAILLVFAIVTVGLRCYTMACVLGRFFLEDWFAVVTLFCYILYSVFALAAVGLGLGQHVQNVPIENRSKALFFKWLAQVFYVLVAVLVKFVVGLLMLRICSHKRWQRIIIYTLLAVVALYNAFYIFVVILQCLPVNYYWLRYEGDHPPQGHCNHRKMALIPTYLSFLMNVVSDFTLAVLPVSFVWHAKMDLKTKISVVGILGLGSIACFATAARIPYAREIFSKPDYLYNFTDMAIWSSVELGLGLTASSLATLKPLFRKFETLAATKNVATSTPHTTDSSNIHSGRSTPSGSWPMQKGGDGSTKASSYSSRASTKARNLDMSIMVHSSLEISVERNWEKTPMGENRMKELPELPLPTTEIGSPERVQYFSFSRP